MGLSIGSNPQNLFLASRLCPDLKDTEGRLGRAQSEKSVTE